MRPMDGEGQIVKLVVVFDAKQKPVFQGARVPSICPVRSSTVKGTGLVSVLKILLTQDKQRSVHLGRQASS